MTNREKAESCGEFVRDGLDLLSDDVQWPSWSYAISRDQIVEGARQAGHWGRLALADKEACDLLYAITTW